MKKLSEEETRAEEERGMVVVELFCKAESVCVGAFKTKGVITALDMTRMGFDKDKARWPSSIEDGVQAVCGRCIQPLYYRDAQGNMFAAMPGTVEFLDDPDEEKRRHAAAVVRAEKEEEERKAKMAKEKAKHGRS